MSNRISIIQITSEADDAGDPLEVGYIYKLIKTSHRKGVRVSIVSAYPYSNRDGPRVPHLVLYKYDGSKPTNKALQDAADKCLADIYGVF